MKKKLSLLLAALMLLGILSACTVNDEAGGNQPAPAEQSAGADAGATGGTDAGTAADATVDRSDIYVGVSINALDAINNQQTYDLMQQKCEKAGFRYAATNANGDAVQQSTDIENLVQMGCNFLVVLNGDTDGLTGAIQEAAAKGVKVISVESGYIDGISAYFAKNDFSLGAAMYMMLASEMGYSGKIIATGHTGHPAIRARVDVQEAMLKEYTGIDCVTFITTGYPGTTELAYNGCETALQQHPDVEAIWCTFDLEALGAARACEDLGMKDVKIVGTDGELDVLYMIRDEKYIIATSVADLEVTTDNVISTIQELADTGSTAMFHEMPYIFIFQTVGRNHRLQAVNPLGLPFKEQTWYTEGEVIKMAEYRKGSHTVYDIKYHFVWITKYRYQVLKGDVALRLRELLRQGCEANHIRILKGSVGTDHVHMLLSCPTTLSPSQIMQYLKGRSSRILQDEYPTLKKRYWGQHMWGRGYFCGTVGEVDQKTIEEYIKNQGREEPTDNFTIVP